MIEPTIGRVVWYTPSGPEAATPGFACGPQKIPAIVCHVWSDTCVNLAVFDANGGGTHSRTSVPLMQEDDSPRPAIGSYCEWMPFQKKQADKQASEESAIPGWNPGPIEIRLQCLRETAEVPTGERLATAKKFEDFIMTGKLPE